MSLPVRIVARFEDALLDAFRDKGSLERLVFHGLGVSMAAEIDTSGSLRDVVSRLVSWADRRGRIVDLLHAALDTAPGNAALGRVRPLLLIVADSVEYLSGAIARQVLDVLRALDLGQAGLDALELRLPPVLRDIMPRSHNWLVRLSHSVALLNGIAPLADGTVPLESWLSGVPAQSTDRIVMERAIDEIHRSVQGVPPIAPKQLAQIVHRPDGREEKIVHQDDMLPIAFLAGGVTAARSVCRLVVPVYVNGTPLVDITGQPRRGYGSGWLVTADLVMTNHHVVNNRSGAEDASEADLRRQAQASIAEFDYDAAGCDPATVAIKEIVAWSPRGGPLDYAIVRLAVPQDQRHPLPIMAEQLVVSPDEPTRPVVNIIQHPGRHGDGSMTMYKMVSCRNNLVFRAEGPNLWYFTDTLAGSSGSPVCNDDWRVVALHKRWDKIDGVNYQGKQTAVANAGTQLAAILDDLKQREELHPVRDEILAAQPSLR